MELIMCRVMRGLIAFGVVVVAGACPPPTPPPPTPEEIERRSFTTNLTDEIILPALTQFAAQTVALRDAPDRESRQQAWLAAMATFQGLEMVHLGPAALPNTFTSGE